MERLRLVGDNESEAFPVQLSVILWWPDRPLERGESVVLGMAIDASRLDDGGGSSEVFRVTMSLDEGLWCLSKFEGVHPVGTGITYHTEFVAIEKAHEWIRQRGRLRNMMLRHEGDKE